MTVRIVLNHLRKKGFDAVCWRKKQVCLDDIPELKGEVPDPVAVMNRAEQERRLREGIDHLPPRGRLFMTLHLRQSLSVEEIASAMNISIQNAYTIKHRAIRKLKAHIQKNA